MIYYRKKLDPKASAQKAEAFEEWEKTLDSDKRTLISAYRAGLNVALKQFGQMAQSELLAEIFLLVMKDMNKVHIK